jgi:hypothetical protein
MLKKCITDTFNKSGKYGRRKQDLIKIHKKMMMLLHEYQAQGLLKKYSVPIPKV